MHHMPVENRILDFVLDLNGVSPNTRAFCSSFYMYSVAGRNWPLQVCALPCTCEVILYEVLPCRNVRVLDRSCIAEVCDITWDAIFL